MTENKELTNCAAAETVLTNRAAAENESANRAAPENTLPNHTAAENEPVNPSSAKTVSERPPILEVRHVSNSYTESAPGLFSGRKKINVLKDVSLTIEQDEFFGLVGESGCGKSTLANCILGLTPFQGEILVNGKKRQDADRLSFSQNVQAVFQDPASALDPRRTIRETLMEPLLIHGIGTKEEREALVSGMLEKVGLDDSYLNRKPRSLSGGQKQRVCIGAALMLSPPLILADEAISSLDVSVGSQILNLFRDIHETEDFAMLFISHNLNVVYYLCDRIAVMKDGQIVEIGDADSICYHPQHPYTRSLVEAAGFLPK